MERRLFARLLGKVPVPAASAPAKSVYSTGGAQALVPGDIGALPDAIVPANRAPQKAVYATGGAQALVPGDIGALPDAIVPANRAPAKAVYSTGGAQALVPGDIGALPDAIVPANRAPAKAVYATGGGQALTPADIGALDNSKLVRLEVTIPTGQASAALAPDAALVGKKVVSALISQAATDATLTHILRAHIAGDGAVSVVGNAAAGADVTVIVLIDAR